MSQQSKQKHYTVFLFSPTILVLVPALYEFARTQRIDLAIVLLSCFVVFCFGLIPALITAWLSDYIKRLYGHNSWWLGLTILSGVGVSLIVGIMFSVLLENIQAIWMMIIIGGLCSIFAGSVLFFWDKNND